MVAAALERAYLENLEPRYDQPGSSECAAARNVLVENEECSEMEIRRTNKCVRAHGVLSISKGSDVQ